jgi:hypothetical protein
MIARDRRAAERKKNLCASTVIRDCDGMTNGVASWMVHTSGGLRKGKMLQLGENITSASSRPAARLAPPKRQRRSCRTSVLLTNEKLGFSSAHSGIKPWFGLKTQNSISGICSAIFLNSSIKRQPYTLVP